jgi:hypothetical protein
MTNHKFVNFGTVPTFRNLAAFVRLPCLTVRFPTSGQENPLCLLDCCTLDRGWYIEHTLFPIIAAKPAHKRTS